MKLYLFNKSNLNSNSNVDNLYKSKNYDRTQKKKRLTLKKKRLTLTIVGLVFRLKFLLIIFLYCTWQIKPLYFFGEKSKMQHISSSLGNDKFLFGMLYINLLNLVWFWSRIWGFYKFWSFKFWGFWYLYLSRLILILHLKCFLFRFMWFFVFLLKTMIFGWLIICLD